MENQNLGRLEDCAKYQQLLQKNLIFLSTMAEKQLNYQNVCKFIGPSYT